MQNPSKKNIFLNEPFGDKCALNEDNLSVHNISMNAVLSSSLNLDSIYKYFSNCIYKPRDFKCIRIDVPVSRDTIDKYTNYIKRKQERIENRKRKRQAGEKEESGDPINNASCSDVKNIPEGQMNGLKHKVRRVEVQSDSNVKTVENILCTSLTKNKIMYSGHLMGLQQPLDVKSSNDDNDVLELLDEMNSTDADFIENEKIIINVSLFANGKLICTGNNSVEACKIAMKKIENKLREYNVKNIKLRRVSITNILAVYNAGFSIVLPLLAQYYKNVDYDPNVFPACKVKIALENMSTKPPKIAENQGKGKGNGKGTDNELAWASTPKNDSDTDTRDIISASIFSTGNITLTGAKNYENLRRTIQILLPYLFKCRALHQHNSSTE